MGNIVSQPTYNDVLILLKLFEMATTPEMREARTWMLAEFKADSYEAFQQQFPLGSAGWRRMTDVCGIMELFGVLLKHDLIGEDIFFDLFGGIDVLWETVARVIPGMRQAIDPRLYENFELLYRRSKEWQANLAPLAH